MFFGLSDPFGTIRAGVEAMLRQQIPQTVVDAIVTRGEPKFLTLGREQTRWFRKKMLVTHFGFCVLATLHVRADPSGPSAALECVLTFLFGRVDQPGRETRSRFLDLEPDLERAFTYDCFKERFLEFRLETIDSGAEDTG